MKKTDEESVKIIIKGAEMEVKMETIRRNFVFFSTYLEAQKKAGKIEFIECNSFDDYLKLLKLGSISYFNPELGISYPSLIIESGDIDFEKVKDYCLDNSIQTVDAEIEIFGINTFQVLILKSGSERYMDVINFCINNDVYFSEANLRD